MRVSISKLSYKMLHGNFCYLSTPPSAANKMTFSNNFITEIDSKFKHYVIHSDFNINMDNLSSSQTRDFSDILDTFNLTQFVPVSTHRAGHILDLVISYKTSTRPLFTRCDDLHISDHKCVTIDLPHRKLPSIRSTISYRDFRKVDIDELKKDIVDHKFLSHDDPGVFFQDYHHALSNLCDKLAPSTAKSIILRPNTQW